MRASDLPAPDRALVLAARDAREHAHAPISRYRVGAAVRTGDGRVFAGCNVEHIVLSQSLCAEAVAVAKAVSEGCTDLREVAVFTASTPPASPCGSCRQLLSYWGVERVLVANAQGDAQVCELSELLPRAFALREPVPVEDVIP